MGRREEDPRALSASEICDVIEDLMDFVEERKVAPPELYASARTVINKLTLQDGRKSTKHILVGEDEAVMLAGKAGISVRESICWFLDEPLKRCDAVVEWALDKVDTDSEAETGETSAAIFSQRGPKMAQLLNEWSVNNQTGVNKDAELLDQAKLQREEV